MHAAGVAERGVPGVVHVRVPWVHPLDWSILVMSIIPYIPQVNPLYAWAGALAGLTHGSASNKMNHAMTDQS